MSSIKAKGPAGVSAPNGPLKHNDHLARGSIRNLNCAAHKVKISDAQERALVDVVRRHRNGAKLQELADYLSFGRLDVARLLARFTCKNFRGELIFREVAR